MGGICGSPSVVVTKGSNTASRRSSRRDAPGIDINNPAFDQHFRITITTDMVCNGAEGLRIAYINKETEMGGVDMLFADLLRH